MRLMLQPIILFGLVLSQYVFAVPHHFLDLAGGGLVPAGHVGVDRRDVLLDGVAVGMLDFGLFGFVKDIVILFGKRCDLLLFLGVEVLGEEFG